MDHPVNLYRVARQCGVKLREAHEHSPTSARPRHCFCKKTLRAIGREHGEEHLRLVLRLIVESRGNECELHAATLKAVSTLVAFEVVPVEGLFEIFDRLDLRRIREWSRAVRPLGNSVAEAMAAALAWEIAGRDHVIKEAA